MAAHESTPADRKARAGAPTAALGDDLDTMSEADRADQSAPVDDESDAPVYPDGPVGERFADEADVLDQERAEPLDDPDEYQPQ